MVRSMPQFGLLAFPVFIYESAVGRSDAAREHADIAAKVHAVCTLDPLRQFLPGGAVQERDSGMVWPDLTKMFLIGSAYTVFTLSRFRKMLAAIQ